MSSDPQVIPDFNNAWKQAISKAKKLISGFSTEEKVRGAASRGTLQLLISHVIISGARDG